ncbi:N-acetylmuramoyl-L-alanine amidase [Streptomyces cyaneofuscatus]|uniref:N-acetylmuramoyl-L-alanine amidase n=1 Tax=Streptomyces TaxID=1883 RepID=UPI000978EA2E|nr:MULTISPECIES: N-acetylmuramoyl-L-alanine amidase [unclassified Streptomyces]ONI53726.1 N-acetylmuramoyl-L-alanine amidase [Streptomyces sp. IB2014 011-1]RDV51983.1 N-acetylmuramoyl-L-alanine amidase [Streptomyces sp. IB2014 011-12]CAD5943270.1 N-acetylmuramoyl-L-alanine amidase [Streptomyces sp. KY75]CAD5986829.1 N-acetylmuramoyl-L-alanine amidase [Streptomyces sp. KY70]
MPYDDSVPPTRRARPLLAAAALAALCLTTITGCGGSPDTAEGKGTDASASPSASAAPEASPSASLPQGPLTGRTVVIDPGHNPRNREHTEEINEQVDIGTGRKECDTTGTSTDDGYAEARFTLDVSHRLRELLQAQGARVLLTHDDDRPFGPCIDERARIGNEAKADAVVSVHADGSAVGNRGFHVILPAAVKGGGADTSKIVKSSADLGARIAGHFVRTTGSAPSNYIGGGTGLDTRDDLGGLNLSTVPKVFVECGNMRDPKDAALLTDARWRQKAAQGMADGIAAHLKG